MDTITLAGCAFIDHDQILLIKRIKTGWYELPGGKIEKGESEEDAARREIKEELLVDITELRKLGQKDFVENGYTMTYNWFQATIAPGQKVVIGEPDKFEHARYIPLKDLRKYKLSTNMENFATELELGNFFLHLPRTK